MKTVIQRVKKAVLTVDRVHRGEISRGLVVLAGFGENDTEADLAYVVAKILHLRIFEDAVGKMNETVVQQNGEIMLVSQFTLFGDCRRGNRPDFTAAAKPEKAKPLYERFVAAFAGTVKNIVSGDFGSTMLVEICNDGPVTILLDSPCHE